MLRFADGAACVSFPLELAMILHHAAQWSTIAGVAVVVWFPDVSFDRPAPLCACDLRVGRERDDAGRDALEELYRYVARSLALEFATVLAETHIRITFAPRRRSADRGPAPGAPPASEI